MGKFKNTKKNSSETEAKEQNNYILYFAETSEFEPVFVKEHKRISKEKLNSIEFSLFIPKDQKSLKKITPKLASLILFDIKMQGVKRGLYYLEKSKEMIFFTFIEENKILSETIKADSTTDRTLFAENYFMGHPYVEVTESEKKLIATYQENNILTAIILFLAIVLFVGYVYSEFIVEETVIETAPKKAEPPIVKPLEPNEAHILKNILAIKVLSAISAEINKYEDKQRFDIQRISSFEMGSISDIPSVQPEYVEDTNTWEYPEEQKKFIRGGFATTLTITHQKKFPSVGYKIETEGGEETLTMYTKTETKNFEIGADDLNISSTELRKEKTLDKICMQRTLKMVDTVLPSEQDTDYIYFSTKKTFPDNLYGNIEIMFDKCPLEIDMFGASEGMLNMNIKMKK